MAPSDAGLEARRLEGEARAAREKIRAFEERYGMSSREFLGRFLRGELGDEQDFIEWWGELVFLEEAERGLEELRRAERGGEKERG
ncbi:hypothetical protein [Pyrolobus fumarii]|uniref:hypothetical protein n=1 Tax=Pyrolobus fumarii TaxID=54252 RepID=UPI00064E65DA|nr:hypothetical protein [Pyrolobus fumarii]